MFDSRSPLSFLFYKLRFFFFFSLNEVSSAPLTLRKRTYRQLPPNLLPTNATKIQNTNSPEDTSDIMLYVCDPIKLTCCATQIVFPAFWYALCRSPPCLPAQGLGHVRVFGFGCIVVCLTRRQSARRPAVQPPLQPAVGLASPFQPFSSLLAPFLLFSAVLFHLLCGAMHLGWCNVCETVFSGSRH